MTHEPRERLCRSTMMNRRPLQALKFEIVRGEDTSDRLAMLGRGDHDGGQGEDEPLVDELADKRSDGLAVLIKANCM